MRMLSTKCARGHCRGAYVAAEALEHTEARWSGCVCNSYGKSHTSVSWRATGICYNCGAQDHYKKDSPIIGANNEQSVQVVRESQLKVKIGTVSKSRSI
ncbi:hypothetical protein J1N35_012088 [Gossypium stocksii]|uniref:Uncharacterized protein n=1 Tax=Gossypium stocksii TaxID=47602 RepID=A0A9D3W5G8_9ROSI|nr:hypothetical protein J1N35_012088 [Gossypium stocksii]